MSQSPSQNRTPRASTTREDGVRSNRQWAPPSLIPEPHAVAGYAHRWVRYALRGEPDHTYFNKALREGWEPCKLADYPELKLHVHERAEGQDKDIVMVGGLVLCRMPSEMVKQRNEYYRSIGRNQLQAEAARLAQINDPRMPMLKPTLRSQAEVKFGNGRGPEAGFDEPEE